MFRSGELQKIAELQNLAGIGRFSKRSIAEELERRKLIELIHHCTSCEECRDEDIADHLTAHGVTIPRWTSVAEGLPENDYGKHWKERKHYLVYTAPSGLMYVAHYGYKDYDWWIDGHDTVLSATNYKEVTHWMPLPNLPKEADNERTD